MKKRSLSVILALLFAFVLLAGCGKVTEANVKERFLPTLEADVYLYGSAFYDVEKNEKGQALSFDDGDQTLGYKIVGVSSVDEIVKKVSEYKVLSSLDKEQLKSPFTEKDGSLYIDIYRTHGGQDEIYDFNSIKLEKTEGDMYYISVDVYAYPDLEGDPTLKYEPLYMLKETYAVKEINGILQIQNSERDFNNNSPVNSSLDDCDLIGSCDKLLGSVLER